MKKFPFYKKDDGVTMSHRESLRNIGGRKMYKVRCFHADGRKMTDDFKIDPESEIGKELQELLAEIDLLHRQKSSNTEENLPATSA